MRARVCANALIYAHNVVPVVNNFSPSCDRFYLRDRPDTACPPSAKEHLSYIARGMHVFIGVFKIVREQSVAKTVEIRANTRARDMSHRFPARFLSLAVVLCPVAVDGDRPDRKLSHNDRRIDFLVFFLMLKIFADYIASLSRIVP